MPPVLNSRFILAEEAAMKAKFSGLKVINDWLPGKPEHDVKVWFQFPNDEVRTQTRPSITINLVDVAKADHREHAGGPHEIGYIPYGWPTPGPTEAVVADDWPTPYDLYFVVTTWASDPRHDRQLFNRLIGDRHLLPHRLGYLELEDGTIRRLELISVDDRTGRDQGGNREFRRAFTLRVESELFTGEVEAIRRAGTLVIDLVSDDGSIREEVETDLYVQT